MSEKAKTINVRMTEELADDAADLAEHLGLDRAKLIRDLLGLACGGNLFVEGAGGRIKPYHQPTDADADPIVSELIVTADDTVCFVGPDGFETVGTHLGQAFAAAVDPFLPMRRSELAGMEDVWSAARAGAAA